MLRSPPASPAKALRAVVAAIQDVLPDFWSDRAGVARREASIFEPLESRRLLSVNVTTYHYSNAETGANTSETTLTLNNVNSGDFGKIASMNVSGQIYGQPLIMTGVPMTNGQGTHDIVLVTTETDLVYAFDAYGNNPAQGYLWKTSLLQTGETPVPESDYGTTDITPSLGITGTPVINPATDILYVVGLFKESNATYAQRIYAINIASGTNAIAPVTIAATFSGSTYNTGTYSNPGGVVTFSAFRENQRPALTLANGEVYIGWSSHGDQNPWHGWVIGYNAATLNQDFVYCDTADGEQGGIWMSGGGLSVDASGNIYFTTGNGTFDANSNTTVDGDYSMSLEELSPSLTPQQYFAPYNEASLSNNDLDFGCANVILLTGQGGAYPNEVLSAGKWGTIYLNNLASLGGYSSSTNNDLGQANLSGATLTTSNVHNTMVYWNGSVYLGGDALALQAFSVANGVLGTTPSSQSSHVFGSASVEDGQGAGLTVSSNGTSDGILWALDNTGFLQSSAVLYAYNASNLSQVLWTSGSAANNRDAANVAIKFQDPVVANGYVYTAGDGSLTVYGLLNASAGTPTVTTPAAVAPSPVTGTTAALSVLGTDPAGDLRPNYTWTATSIPSGATAPTFSSNDTNTANDQTVTFYKAGAYTFTATIEDPNSGLTTTSTVNVTVNQTLTAMAVTPASANVVDSATQQFTASFNDQFGLAMTSQPAFTWSVATGGAGGSVNSSGLYTAPASGGGTDIVTATANAGAFSASATVTVAVPSSTYQISLTNDFNHFGIAASGTHAVPAPGIDGDQDALAGALLGTSQTWNGSSFVIGPTTTANNSSNVVDGAGQTIALSPGHYTSIKFLALHVNGNGTDPFTLDYSDGSTQAITQGFSDWYTPQNYTGEAEAVSMSYRITSNGGHNTGPFYLYGYVFTPIYGKTLTGITLPSDAELDIASMDAIGTLVPTVVTPAAANPTTVTGATTILSVGGTDPTGDASPTFTWVPTNMPSGAVTTTFNVNGTTTSNLSTATFHTAGAYTFTVYITDPTTLFNVSSSVSVTVNQALTSINVTPTGTAGLYNGQTQQFSADALDQFGASMSPQPSFTWTVPTGIGSVSSAGLYQAPASGIGSATVKAASGSVSGQAAVQVHQPAWLGAGSIASWNSATGILTVTGASSIVADPGSAQPIVEANGSSAVVTINPAGSLQIHIGGLSLTNGATATVISLGAARTASNHRVLVLGLPGATSAPLLTIGSTSQLNLADNDLVDHDGNITAINGLLQSGFNAAAGYWNGPGIASGNAAVGTLTALGEAQPAVAGTFDNETVGTSDVEIRYTYAGDANLDGHVDGSDYSLIDNGFLRSLTGWSNGDFNYDGVVNGSDYTLIDNAFNRQAASLDAAVATPAAQAAATATPATAAFAGAKPTTASPTTIGSAAPTVRPDALVSKAPRAAINSLLGSTASPSHTSGSIQPADRSGSNRDIPGGAIYVYPLKRPRDASTVPKPGFSDVKISVGPT
jgi:hypothetical protein